jgi:hypothetical protein
MPAPKKPAATKAKANTIPVRIPVELLERADRLRGPYIPREAFIRDLLDKALKTLEGDRR